MPNEAKKTPMQKQSGARTGLKSRAAGKRRAGAEAEFLPAIRPSDLPPETRSAVSRLMAELDRLKEELSAARGRVIELENKADEDVLLPVLNRRGFDRELERTLAYVKRHGTDVSLIFIDLDNFKSINDLHGHAAGDAALMHLTDILIANVRRSDIVARLGGDEFAVLLHRAGEEAASMKADQLSRALASSGLVYEGKEIAMSLTAGATRLRADDTNAAALGRADKLMYEAKMRRNDARRAHSA
ncbi:diguanylate cyclase DosC [bacterium BMS3Bbin10]|nr:diguanylate cyclase DosC [bacterium BMS3Bbin10]